MLRRFRVFVKHSVSSIPLDPFKKSCLASDPMSEVDEIIYKHFPSVGAFCRAFGVSRQAVSNWRKSGIPKLRRDSIELWLLRNAVGESPAR